MILLATAFIAGDFWTWDVTLRYDNAAEQITLIEKERWTVRVDRKDALIGERKFLGTLVEGDLIPSADHSLEIIKGAIGPDGTLTLKPDWSDPAATRLFRRLLNPDKKLDDRLKGWTVVRHAVIKEAETKLPGSYIPVSLAADVTLTAARLGGQDIKLKQ